MREQIAEYVISLYRDIPMAVYEGLLSVLCLGAVVVIACYGLKRGRRRIAGLLLVEYIFLIYCSTVIYRKGYEGAGYELIPFWSYNDPILFVENVMNVVAFIPIGLLMAISQPNMKWWRLLLIGIFLSVGIEALQFFFVKGFSEVDDVIHNTLGCMIGIALACIPMFMIRKLKKQ